MRYIDRTYIHRQDIRTYIAMYVYIDTIYVYIGSGEEGGPCGGNEVAKGHRGPLLRHRIYRIYVFVYRQDIRIYRIYAYT